MTIRIGQATTCTSILPNSRALARVNPKKLSPDARFRLRFIDCYRQGQQAGGGIRRTVTEVCRLFGIARSLFYKWYNRFDPSNLSSLEDRSSRPHRVRQATYDTTLISLIRQYRQDKDFATYSGKKLAIVFKRDYPDRPEFHYSGATLGRIITTYKLFFTEVVKAAKERSKRALATWKKRKPAGLHNVLADAPRKLIEFDMKHIYAGGKKYYAFCAIDVYTREALLHVASTSTSRQARIALEKVVDVFGRNITLLNDNGSENHGEAYSYLKDTNITQYFARPRQPKDKPYIERLIGSYQRECLDQYRADITTLEDLDYYTTRWTNNYHYTRPHDSLNGKTPDEFCATLNITIERRKVSTR